MFVHHNRLLGPSNPSLRLPTRVYKSSTSTSQVSQLTHSGPKGLCSEEHFGKRDRSPARKEVYNLSSSQHWPRFHLDLLSGSQETQQVATNYQPSAPHAFIRPKLFRIETLRTVLQSFP